METGLKGKCGLITGSTYGIGKSIALALADEGCNVAVCARNKDRVSQTVKEIKKKGVECLGIPADVMNLDDIERVMKTIIEVWGTIHILVNNAGGGGKLGEEDVLDTPESIWRDVYNKNALAAVRFTMKALSYMKKQRWGRIVNITSIQGREGGGRPWYAMAKSAEACMMKALSMYPDLAERGITFNSVAPGTIAVTGVEWERGWERQRRENPIEFEAMIKRRIPQGHMGTPEEVASVVVFLCSEKASLVNGATIPVDGGEGRSF